MLLKSLERRVPRAGAASPLSFNLIILSANFSGVNPGNAG